MPRRLPPPLTRCLLAAALAGCASTPATTTEHIGGRLRMRAYASATAYEAFLRGELAAARGDFVEADRQMDLATFADESDPWIVARRVHHLVAANQRARAIEVARAATSRYASASAAWLSLASALGDEPATLAERDAALARAVGLDPGDAEVRATAVRIASRHTTTDAAPARLIPPADPVERLAGAGAWARAAALIASSARIDGPDAGPRLALAVARVCAGDRAGALGAVGALSRRRGSVDRAAVAWLWLRAGEVTRALEESALGMAESVRGAATVRALALAEADRATEALRVAILVGVDDRAPDAAPSHPSPWAGRCARSGTLGLAEGTPRGSALALTAPAVAAALDRAGRTALADALMERTMTRLRALDADGAAARDALRQAAAARFDRLGRADEARSALAGVEGVDGRLARAAAGAWDGASATVTADLTAAAAEPATAPWAAAWRVLACSRPGASCAAPDVEAARGLVRASADEAPVVALARAFLAGDADAAARAGGLDAAGAWGRWVAGQVAPAAGDRGP